MLSQRKLNALVERVLKRLDEAPSDLGAAYSKTLPVPSTAPTQFPGQDNDKRTVPAAQSKTQQDAERDFGTQNTRNPKANPPSQKIIKVNSIRKALDKSGYTSTADKAQHVTQNLNGWYDTLDPADALINTADELARRFSEEG